MSGELKHADPGVELTSAEYLSGTGHTIDSGAAGDTLYFDGTSIKRVPIGAPGQVLGIVGTTPTWVSGPSFSGTLAIEVTSSIALTVAQLNPNYVFQVDTLTASAATGIKITGAAAGSRISLAAISSGANEGLDIDAKGSGTVRIANASTGNILLQRAVQTASVVALGGSTPTTTVGMLLDTALSLTGTTQRGIQNSYTISSAGTSVGVGLEISLRTAVAAFTVSNLYNLIIADASKGAGSSITNQYGVYINSLTSGGTDNYGLYISAPSGGAGSNIGIYNAGTSLFLSRVSIGLAPLPANIALTIQGALTTTSATQYGIYSAPTFSSASSTAARAIYAQVVTTAAVFTVSAAAGVYIADPSKGAGSGIANNYGLIVDSMTAGTGDNTGIFINTPSGGSGNNIGLYNSGTSRLNGSISIGTNPITHAGIYQVITLTGSSGGNQWGAYFTQTFNSSATSAGRSVASIVVTAAAAFTMTNAYAFYAYNASKGAGSSITNNYGLYIESLTAGATGNYGVYIEVPSGATNNFGLVNRGETLLASGVCIGTSAASTPEALEIRQTAIPVALRIHVPGSFEYKIGTPAAVSHLYLVNTNSAGAGAFTNNGVIISTTGNVGLGSPPVAAYNLLIAGAITSGASQFGVVVAPTASSAATTEGRSVYAQVGTAASVFTMTSAYAFYADNPNKGAGSTITTSYGIYVAAQTAGATNYAIFTNGGTVQFGDGVVVGSATGGNKGAGTINVATDIYKNNTAYTNPDYVFEHFYTGTIRKYIENDGAASYGGLLPLDKLRDYVKMEWHLPRIPQAGGIFDRADAVLASLEEAYLYIFDLETRIKELEAAKV